MTGSQRNHNEIDPTSLFSDTYVEARSKILQATQRDRVITHTHPHLSGRNRETLTMDFVHRGEPKAKKVLLFLSAVHGVEGFCGSACQLGLIKTLPTTPPKDIQIIWVHAVNPYGFSWIRRVNEDNVDLNRNFIDHAAPPPDNPGYRELADAMAPKDLSKETLKQADTKLFAYGKKYGFDKLQEAMIKGQYSHPDGLYYGGTKPAWSNTIIQNQLSKSLTQATDIIAIDFHTGLGPSGHGELISLDPTSHPAFKRARALWGNKVTSTKDGSAASVDLLGNIDTAFPHIAPQAEITFVTLEFGTVDGQTVFEATRADNWLHLFGDLQTDRGIQIKQDLKHAFYPSNKQWQEMIWTQARDTAIRALESFQNNTSSKQ